jgi:hypothetical protein
VDFLPLEETRWIDGYEIRSEFEHGIVTSNEFIDMCAKCGNSGIAHKLFKIMPKSVVASWNEIIVGLFQYWPSQ